MPCSYGVGHAVVPPHASTCAFAVQVNFRRLLTSVYCSYLTPRRAVYKKPSNRYEEFLNLL